jgi:microsomal epoxide hydrolase
MGGMRALLRVALILLLAGLAWPAQAADRWFATSDGVRLHYTDTGRGHTIVLIPGWTMPGWIFQPQITDLGRSYRVIAFDPRGQGQSDVPEDGYEPYRRGQDIAELLAHLGGGPPLLLGWSLGVLDALAYVHEHGDAQLAGMVLVDNSVGENPPPALERGPPAGRHRRALDRAALMQSFVRSMFARPEPVDYLRALTEATLRTPQQAAAELLAYPVPRTFWRDAVFSTTRPVLYLVRPGLAGQAQNLEIDHPGAECVVLRGVGHAMFVDDPAGFDALVRGFIRRRIWP